MKKTPDLRSWLLIAAFLLVNAGGAFGYLVGPPEPLEKLTAGADLIFKGEAVESVPVVDSWFTPVAGYGARETRFKVVSLIKGEAQGGQVRFRHFDEESGDRRFEMNTPPVSPLRARAKLHRLRT